MQINIQNLKQQSGFTLLEILLVVAAIAILAGIVIFAINPSKQLGDTRNAQRKVDVNTILNAIHQYAIDNNGSFPTTIPVGTVDDNLDICQTGQEVTCGAGYVDLSVLTNNGKYLVSIPVDPGYDNGVTTNYQIYKDVNNRIHVFAQEAENDEAIEVVR